MSESFYPVGDYIQIQPERVGEKMGNLLTPEHLKGALKPYGKVIAVGEGTPISPMRFKEGDEVFFNQKQNLIFGEGKDVTTLLPQHNVIAKRVGGIWVAENEFIFVSPRKKENKVEDFSMQDWLPEGLVVSVSPLAYRHSGIRQGMHASYYESPYIELRMPEEDEVIHIVEYLKVEKCFETGKGRLHVK